MCGSTGSSGLSLEFILKDVAPLSGQRQVFKLKLYTGSEVTYGVVRTGCRLWRLWPSRLLKDSGEGAEEIEVRR